MIVALNNYKTKDKSILSVDQDGVVIRWDKNEFSGLEGEHFQFASFPVKLLARNPTGTEIAIYESDNLTNYHISILDWENLTKKYTIRLSDEVTTMAFSAQGTYLICGTRGSDTKFINTATGEISDVLINSTGAIDFVYTASSEKSIAFYTPNDENKGYLTYSNLKTGKRIKKLRTDLIQSQVCFFDNANYLAGVTTGKNGDMLRIHMATPDEKSKNPNNLTLLGSYAVSKPILIGAVRSSALYYITNEAKLGYRLYKIEADPEKKTLKSPVLVKNITGLASKESITCATLLGNMIYIGTSNGNVYELNCADGTTNETVFAATDNEYKKILAVANIGETCYLLTNDSILETSYTDNKTKKISANDGYTDIIPYKTNLILWAKNKKKAAVLFNPETGKQTSLYPVAGPLQSLKLTDEYLIALEDSSKIYRFNLNSKKKTLVYSNGSLYDAELLSENNLYIAKTRGTTPKVPFLYLNLKSNEKVPVNSVSGNLVSALSYDLERKPSEIFGIVTKSDTENEEATTSFFAYDTKTKKTRTFHTVNTEEYDSFTFASWPYVYTNLGKTSLKAYNLEKDSVEEQVLQRGSGNPEKLSKSGDKLILVNKDGSVSWYDFASNRIISNWYVTQDDELFTF
ncbi:hypothetical protein [Treponema zioleckii]|uniref:hypothetical protein n=1 Tax=Treponema zioleckii TaxID=331680 RepID=UPI00168A7D92|nr:hypothetical protein [Treponema zioleckii]